MPEPQRPRVLAAVLQTLSEHGPCPTAFQASPAASYRHGDKIGRAAAGWWVCYAARLQITAFDEPDRGEVVHMGFHGEGVHGAEPFAWELSFVTDTDGVQSVVLVDHASYPRPLRHALQYYAISQCRDALLQGTAARLGQQIHARQGLRAVVHGVLAALGFADAAVRSQRAAYESQRARMPRTATSMRPHTPTRARSRRTSKCDRRRASQRRTRCLTPRHASLPLAPPTPPPPPPSPPQQLPRPMRR